MGTQIEIPRLEANFAVPGTEVRIAEGVFEGHTGVIAVVRGDIVEVTLHRPIGRALHVAARRSEVQEIAMVAASLFDAAQFARFREGDVVRTRCGTHSYVVPTGLRYDRGDLLPIVGVDGAHASAIPNGQNLYLLAPPPNVANTVCVTRIVRGAEAEPVGIGSPLDTGVKKFREQLERDLQAHYSAVLFAAPPPFRSKSVNRYSLAVSLFRTDPRILAIVDAKAEGKTEQRAGCFFVAAHREPAIVAECIARAEAMIADENAMWPIYVLHHPSRIVDARPIGRRVEYDFVEEEFDVNTGEVVASKVLGQSAPVIVKHISTKAL